MDFWLYQVKDQQIFQKLLCHNFIIFIYRLINEKDLRLIDNVISTLDSYSKQLIPTYYKEHNRNSWFSSNYSSRKIEDKDERPNSDDISLVEFME